MGAPLPSPYEEYAVYAWLGLTALGVAALFWGVPSELKRRWPAAAIVGGVSGLAFGLLFGLPWWLVLLYVVLIGGALSLGMVALAWLPDVYDRLAARARGERRG